MSGAGGGKPAGTPIRKEFRAGERIDGGTLSTMVDRIEALEDEVRRLRDEMYSLLIVHGAPEQKAKSTYEMTPEEYLAKEHKL